MFETSADILNIALAIGFSLIAVFLSVALFYAIFVLRDLGETTKALKHTANQVDNLLVQPTKILSFLFDKVRDVASLVEGHVATKRRKK